MSTDVGSTHGKVGISFRCGVCEKPAKIVVDDVDMRVELVFCPSCGDLLEGPLAHIMCETFIKRYAEQKARQFPRKSIRGRFGRLPITDVDNEFTDPTYPFVMVANDD